MSNVTTPSVGTGILQSWGAAVAGRLSTGCALYDGATSQAISTGIGTLTDLTLSAAQVTSDPGAWFSDADDAIVIPEAGVYLVTAYIGWANNATGDRRGAIKINGTARWQDLRVGSLSQPNGHNLVMMFLLAAADKITFSAAQSSGGNLNVTSKALSAWRCW